MSGGYTPTDITPYDQFYSLDLTGGTAAASGTCGPSATYTVQGEYRTSAGQAATVTPVGASQQANPLSASTSWTHFSFAFPGPASCSGATVSIALQGGVPGQPVYFDNISISGPSVGSGANLLSNAGFEALYEPWGAAGLGRLRQAQSHSGAMSMLTPSGGVPGLGCSSIHFDLGGAVDQAPLHG